jgi:hypothetical protein
VTKNRWESGYRLTASDDNAYLLSYLVLGFKLCSWGDPSIPDAETVEIPNRRKAARFEFIDRLPLYEHRSYRQIGMLADLSIDGFRIITETPMSKDEILKCRLQLPKKVLRVELLSLTTQCMWCRPTGSKGRYESGHKFVDVSKEDSAVLLHLMVNYGKPRHGEKKIVVVG